MNAADFPLLRGPGSGLSSRVFRRRSSFRRSASQSFRDHRQVFPCPTLPAQNCAISLWFRLLSL